MGEKVILIVDDDRETREILKKYFTSKKYKIIEANDGLEGWKIIKRGEKIDLVILDVVMPKMDGFSLLDKLKKSQKYKNIPVIMLTIKKESEYLAKGISLQSDFYLPKPFRINNLMNFVKFILE